MNLGEWLSARPWTFWVPAPAVMVHAVILSRSSRVWTELMRGTTRSGRATATIAAHFHLGLLGLALVFYAVLSLRDPPGFRGRIFMRPPTDAEQDVAYGMMRGLVALGMYLGTWVLWRRFG